MNTADYLVIATILVSASVGLLRGFLREAIALISWVVALVLAYQLGPRLEPYLGGLLASAQVRPWVARLLVLGAALLVGAAIGAIVVYFVRLSLFSGVDRFLGFMVGLLRGILVLGIAALFCLSVRLDSERWWHKSMLLPYAERVASVLRSLAGGSAHERQVSVQHLPIPPPRLTS
jgi:membrane protein required for colicin V production